MLLIYLAENKIDGRRYVGQTRHPLSIRWSQHKHEALKRKPRTYFHKAIALHGVDAFTVRVIAFARTDEELNELERIWIEHFRSADRRFGYNLTHGGEGIRPSEETRAKMSASAKRRCTPEWKAKIGARAKKQWAGVPKSAEHRAKIGAANKGTKPSAATILAVIRSNQRRAKC